MSHTSPIPESSSLETFDSLVEKYYLECFNICKIIYILIYSNVMDDIQLEWISYQISSYYLYAGCQLQTTMNKDLKPVLKREYL